MREDLYMDSLTLSNTIQYEPSYRVDLAEFINIVSQKMNSALPTSHWEAKGLKSLLSCYLNFVDLLDPSYAGLHIQHM